MKKTLVLMALLFLAFNLQGQSNTLSKEQQLAATAKIWGFLKYYHPEVAQGKFDWDLELINLLPLVESPMSRDGFSQVLNTWIDELGEVEKCKKCQKASDKDYFGKNFDLSWMDDKQLFHPSLSGRLRFIEKNRFLGPNHYAIPTHKNVGNFNPQHEEFAGFDWSSKEHQMVLAFKYWNMVEYFFPYKYQTDTPWSTVLSETIEEILQVQSKEEYELALRHLIIKIDDGHGYINFDDQRPMWIPNRIAYVEDQFVVVKPWNDSIAQFSSLEKGDVIKAINGRSIEELKQEEMARQPGSNLLSKYRNMGYIFGQSMDKSSIQYTVERDGQIKTLDVPVYTTKEIGIGTKQEVKKWKLLDNNIGFINMGIITPKEVFTAMKELKDTDGLIIDVRNYPKGSMYALSGRLVHQKKDFCKVLRPDYSYPGKFYWDSGLKTGYKKRGKAYEKPIVVLVNEQTQSHAEFSVMSLQAAEQVTTIGRQTAGADGNICRIQLGDNYKTAFSGIGIFYPDGSITQRSGVHIDQVVERTIAGVKAGKDEVLEVAIQMIVGE